MNETTYDCIVIGGGISGISFACYLGKAGKKVLIIEKNNRIGGQIQTEHHSVNPDYWFEMGSHTCYNSYTNLLSIVNETDNNELIEPLQKHSFVLYSSGKIKSIFSEVFKLPMILCCFKFPFANKTGKTTREYFRPLVGARNYDKLFRNAFKAVICQPADDYPAEIFLKKRKERYKELPRRVTFNGGLSSILNAIVEKNNIEIELSSEIINIQKTGDIFDLKTKDGKIFQSRNIALAVNPQISSSLIKNIEGNISELLSTIPLFHSESLNVIIPKEKLALKEIAGIISLSDDFLSAVSRDLVGDEQLRSFTFHFEKGKKNKDEIISLICKVLSISPSDIAEQTYTEHTLPAMRLEHLHMAEKVKERRKDDTIYILGNYFHGLSLEDCVNRSKLEAERFLNNRL
jgi:protoporphyrinogen oxidase